MYHMRKGFRDKVVDVLSSCAFQVRLSSAKMGRPQRTTRHRGGMINASINKVCFALKMGTNAIGCCDDI